MTIQEYIMETSRAETRLAKSDVQKLEQARGKKIGAILRELVIEELERTGQTPESTEVKHGDASRIPKKV